MDADPKRVAAWLVLIAVPIAVGSALALALKTVDLTDIANLVIQRFPAIIGLPVAGLVSAFVVIGLQYSEGPIKFKAMGFEFEGAAGQVILWVICFIAISGMIRLLWGID